MKNLILEIESDAIRRSGSAFLLSKLPSTPIQSANEGREKINIPTFQHYYDRYYLILSADHLVAVVFHVFLLTILR